MIADEYKNILIEGLWRNNPALVQLLGLCPLLAVSSTVINGVALGMLTMIVMILTNLIVSVLKNRISDEIRLPVFVLLISVLVTLIELLIQTYFYDIYLSLGIFIPLIITNCAIIGRAEAYASKNSVPHAVFDGFSVGLGFTAVLIVLGALREVVGYGTLLRNSSLLLGDSTLNLQLTVFEHYDGFLLAILPPGAFFALALLIALKNYLVNHYKSTLKDEINNKYL